MLITRGKRIGIASTRHLKANKYMPNQRRKDLKRVGFWVSGSFKKRLEKEAKRRGMPVSDLIREMIGEELGDPYPGKKSK